MKKTLLTLSLIVLSAAAYAQDSHTEAVNELMNVMEVENRMNEAAERMFEVQAKAMPQISQYKDIMIDFFQKYISWDTVGDQVKQVYKESFTEEEIRDLIAFFKTDTGQKFSRINPEISQKIAEISQKITMEHQAELQQKIMNAMGNQ